MLKSVFPISVFLLLSFTIGCTSTVMKYRDVTTYDTTYVKIPEVVARYRTDPPEFSFPSPRAALVTVLPFSSASEQKALSVTIAEEVEYAMVNHPLAPIRYIIYDRSRLEELWHEKSLPAGSTEAIKEARRLLGVEYLVTGFIHDPNRIRYTVKVIDTKDARILFAKKIEGTLTEAAAKTTELFHEKRVIDRYDTLFVKQEPRVRPLTKSFPYEVRQHDPGKTSLLIILILGGIIGAVTLVAK